MFDQYLKQKEAGNIVRTWKEGETFNYEYKVWNSFNGAPAPNQSMKIDTTMLKARKVALNLEKDSIDTILADYKLLI